MPMNPFENGVAERVVRTDPELLARVQSIETLLPTLATRAEMLEAIGGVRVEIQALRGDMKECMGEMRVEMHRTVMSTMKWSISISLSCVGVAATLMTAVMPLIEHHLRG